MALVSWRKLITAQSRYRFSFARQHLFSHLVVTSVKSQNRSWKSHPPYRLVSLPDLVRNPCLTRNASISLRSIKRSTAARILWASSRAVLRLIGGVVNEVISWRKRIPISEVNQGNDVTSDISPSDASADSLKNVPCSWFLVLGSLFLVPCCWFLVPGCWFLVPGSCFLVLWRGRVERWDYRVTWGRLWLKLSLMKGEQSESMAVVIHRD